MCKPGSTQVDVSRTEPFPGYWKRSFGSGHAALTLRPDYQQHLRQAVTDLGLQGVRYHGASEQTSWSSPRLGWPPSLARTPWLRAEGIFDDDMGVVTGFRTYNFSRILSSWDFQLSLGLTPIVELSFMPAVLANCSWSGVSDLGRPGFL